MIRPPPPSWVAAGLELGPRLPEMEEHALSLLPFCPRVCFPRGGGDIRPWQIDPTSF